MRIRDLFFQVFGITILCSLLAGGLFVQVGMATLSGTVTDPAGAAVPGALVTLQSTTQTAARHTTTNATGQYVIPAIHPGTYELFVEAKGFQQTTVRGVILDSGQGTTVNVALRLATAHQQVVVTGAPPLLQTTTATLGSNVTARQFTHLPLLGRDFTSLVDILPGVAPVVSSDANYASSGVQGLAVMPSVYGQRQRDSSYTLDGAIDVTSDFTTLAIIPPPEAINEMKVQSGMDSGAYGWASGANVSIVTKSGTNQYHGSAWEYLRNSALNARSFFIPSVGQFRWNQFGFAAGGPFIIPHVLPRRKHLYLFGYYEGIRINNASNFTGLVPTPAQLTGDFSGSAPLFNPYTTVANSSGNIVSRQPFTNNQIPSNLLSPTSLAIAKGFYPKPNFIGVIPGVNFLSTLAATDNSHQWGVRGDREFGTENDVYVRYSGNRDYISSIGLPTIPSTSAIVNMNGVAAITHTFSPTFIVTGRMSVERFTRVNREGGPDVAKSTGLVNVFPPFEGIDFVPTMSIAGYTGVGQFQSTDVPWYYYVPTVDFSKVFGRHTFSFGGGYTRATLFNDQTQGGENFAAAQTALGAGTGDALASFLLGLPNSANRVGGVTGATFRFNEYNWYLQDTFRATRKWTFNLGMRWDYISPMDVSPGVGTFDIVSGRYLWDATNPITGQPPNMRRGGVQPDYDGFQPRFGAAYALNQKTTARASFGIFDDVFGANQQSPTGIGGNWPYAFPQDLTSANVALPDTFIQSPFPGPPVGSPTPLGCAQCQNIEVSSTRNPYVEEWSFSLQRQITHSLMAEADYFGSHGVRLLGQVLDNLAPTPGLGPLNQRRPFPQFPGFVDNGWNEYMSWYDGLDFKLKKVYSRNLQFLITYTYSKAMDQSDSLGTDGILGEPGANATRNDVGQFTSPAGFDTTSRFTGSYIYDTPDIPGLEGKGFGPRLASEFLNHWEVSGIVSADTGFPYSVFLTGDNENIGIATFGSQRFTEFPNLVCAPNAGITETLSEAFNTSCYQLPQFGTLGNAGQHRLYSDGMPDWDQAISKRWSLGESRDIEFRAEAFNLTNAHTFDPPNAVFGTSSFGEISNVRQGGRQFQFSLHVDF